MSHDVGDRPERDMRRDAWLESQGLTVMRIAAGDVMMALDETADGVVRMATALIEGGNPHRHASRDPPPPFDGGG
jgi:very-short-patch-repair endonuclease